MYKFCSSLSLIFDTLGVNTKLHGTDVAWDAEVGTREEESFVFKQNVSYSASCSGGHTTFSGSSHLVLYRKDRQWHGREPDNVMKVWKDYTIEDAINAEKARKAIGPEINSCRRKLCPDANQGSHERDCVCGKKKKQKNKWGVKDFSGS